MMLHAERAVNNKIPTSLRRGFEIRRSSMLRPKVTATKALISCTKKAQVAACVRIFDGWEKSNNTKTVATKKNRCRQMIHMTLVSQRDCEK